MKTNLLLLHAALFLVGCASYVPNTDFVLTPFESDVTSTEGVALPAFESEESIDESLVLTRFESDESLRDYLHKSEVWSDMSTQLGYGCDPELDPDLDSDLDPDLECVVVTGSFVRSPVSAQSDSITNNQESGVDEGDIVKRIGNYIVLLRRGRLFSFSLPSDISQLRVVDFTDVAPANEEIDAWYDEILVYGSTIILTGYSYELESVLIRLFEIDSNGELWAGESHFFTSSDYFNSENYATRIVGDKLIFYMPGYLLEEQTGIVGGQLVNGMPTNVGSAFSSQTIYQPLQQSEYPVLHTVATCPLNEAKLYCTATSFFGPEVQLFYISNDSVYLWLNSEGWAIDYYLLGDRYVRLAARYWRSANDFIDDLAVVYRVPIDGSEPGAVRAFGWPMNQFSFRETQDSLQVLTRDSDYTAESVPGVLSIPLSLFSSQVTAISPDNYQALPRLDGSLSSNRFIGDYLLYGDTDYLEDGGIRSTLLVKNLESDSDPLRLPLNHHIERIEPLGERAIIIGTDDVAALGLTSIDLSLQPGIELTTWLERAMQSDERSHSFNFLRNQNMDVFGIPVVFVPAREAYENYIPKGEYETHISYYSLTPDSNLRELGQLSGRAGAEDYCVVSCSDWYGDSRPFFIDDRVYALLGYELVEGIVQDGRLRETSRGDALSLISPVP